MGGLRFSNAGPACGSCHDASGARFPAGGTLGPDLTNSYVRFGPAAMQLFLDTLYFPTMAPVFNDHPLTPGEKADLAAFLQHAPNHTRARPPWAIPALALGGFCVLILLTALASRRQLRAVRRPLIHQESKRRQSS